MKWSLKLGKLLGIDVYLHFTSLPLLAFLEFHHWRGTQNFEAGGRIVGLLTLENFSEMIMVNAAMKTNGAARQ